MSLIQALMLAAAGFVGGAVNAIAGGGSLIVFPALLATGYGALAANVTNSLAQWPGYLGGVAGFRHELTGQRRRLVLLSLTGIAGAATGSAVLLLTPAAAFDAVVPFLVLLASLLLAVQPRIRRLGGGVAAGAPDNYRLLLPAMFVAGGYGGYFGGALGVILIGVLSLTVHDTLRRINALKASLSAAVATVTIVIFSAFAPVNWVGVAVIAPMALLGGYTGARIARRLDDRVLRWSVVTFGVVIAVVLYLKLP